jgi:gluconolactonase
VTGWNEFNRPNGCLVSADGATFYLGTREDTIWMFDIGGDGSLTNKRPFAELPPPVFPRDKDRGRGTADGMTIDRDDNVWIATNFGIQVFDRSGEYIGNVRIPLSPSHCAFGGEDLSTLHITSRNHIYRLRTAARGYLYPITVGQ